MVAAAGDPLGRISDGALAAREGRVVWIGEDRELESQITLDGDLLDAQGACVIPGLVDAHTHPVFAGSRADEFAERVSGVAYGTQQSGERGIARTVRATREADVPTLLELAIARHGDHVDNHGCTSLGDQRVGIEKPRAVTGRMAAPAGDERAVNQYGFAAQIAPGEVGGRAHSHP